MTGIFCFLSYLAPVPHQQHTDACFLVLNQTTEYGSKWIARAFPGQLTSGCGIVPQPLL